MEMNQQKCINLFIIPCVLPLYCASYAVHMRGACPHFMLLYMLPNMSQPNGV